MEECIFYKYRDFSNLQRVLDIFVSKRMYAAHFQTLNDPMEGIYLYDRHAFCLADIERLYAEKLAWRLLSLTKNSNNMLMWSHYANNHTGVAIGVSIDSGPDLEIERVDYVSDVNGFIIDPNCPVIVRTILTKKLALWDYEEEWRAFTRNNFVDVQVREVVFGLRTDSETKKLVETVARTFVPDILVRTQSLDDLNKGRLPASVDIP